MAETLLSPVIEKLIDLLIKEAKSLKGVNKQVKSLQKELETIEPLLRDAEANSARGELSDASKVWLRQLREEAERIEDIVDEYTYYAEQNRQDQDSFFGSLRKIGRCAKSLTSRSDLSSEIQDIEDSLRKIKERGLSYGLRPFEQGGSSHGEGAIARVDPRIGSLFIDDDELVGIESISEELVRVLVEGHSVCTVVSLVGEGGIGKTTLARKVYNDVAEIGHFDHRVWVTVSQSYDINKILKILIDQICPQSRESFAIEEAFTLLRSSLQAKRYVIVFDDVWQIDLWSDIKHAFPSNSLNSGIIFTTRNSTVVESLKPPSGKTIVKELKSWSIEQSWELFCKKAFPFSSCPPELERLSCDIISKCQGLPLAIVVVASLLSKKNQSKVEWQKVLDYLNNNTFEGNRELSRVSEILVMSYHDLPYHLKPCFLYFGIFPEDYSISGDKICQLWIAEGFIKSRDNETLEHIAEEYLTELNNRNLISFRFKFGSDRRCIVHDLIGETIHSIATNMCFYHIIDQSQSSNIERIRRAIIYNTTGNVLKVGDSKIRSVVIFNTWEETDFVYGLLKSCKLLKVLDFSRTPMYSLPKEVTNLFHLRYLNLKGTFVKFLPKSIGKLHNLQMLDVSLTLVRELPVEINKLRKLRHLVANNLERKEEYNVGTYIGVRTHKGIGELDELQTLTRVEAPSSKVDFIKELRKLRRLKCLGISRVNSEMGKALGESIERMDNLEKLLLSSSAQNEVLDLNSILCPPPFLRYLRLSCQLQIVPNWIPMLENLQGLELNFSRMIDDPLRCCKRLPNLTYLRLYQAYEGEELHFEKGGFRKLKQLFLKKLEGLKVIKIEEGALPSLEELEIGPFPLMTEMPCDIQHLTRIRSLRIFDMPIEFESDLQTHGGSGYFKIQHIPSVTFWNYRGMGIN